jgi:Glycosyltransferase family 87
MRGPWLKLVLALAMLALLAGAAPAFSKDDPAGQPPFGGERPPPLVEPDSTETPPPGFGISAREAIERAGVSAVVREELAETPGARPEALVRGRRWQVSYFDSERRKVAELIIDGSSGEVDEAWRDYQVETELARGYEGAIAQLANAPYLWLPLCLLFLAPFIDPRRPARLLHLDLLVLLGLGLSLFFFNRAEITASVALTYPVLGYFLLRMLIAGLWPRERPGPLLPWAPVRWLAIGVIVLAAARIALNVLDSQVIDVGVAGVIGADRIGAGAPLYEGDFSDLAGLRGDVYGPANYLAYLPFEQVFGWEGEWGDVPAAHAAAIAFDLLCVAGLVALGRRLRAGDEGRALGWALGFAWVACPWTLYTMNANANDALVAALSIAALLALRSAPARGAFVALAAAAKFGSAALAPLFATADGERRWRGAIVFGLAFAAVTLAVTLPFVPDGGLSEMYDRTLGYQATRSSPFSVWGQAPALDFLQPVVRVAAVALALAVAVYPRFKTPLQIAALAAAVTIAVQLTASHWFYFYVVWFLPLVLVASFGSQAQISRSASPGARAGAS